MKKDDESIAEEIDVVGTRANVLVLRLRCAVPRRSDGDTHHAHDG